MATSPKSSNRRLGKDIVKLVDAKHMVQMSDVRNELYVMFHGPRETPYEGGFWKVFVHIPENYPFKSPSIGFMNKIFHPNIDENSGAICLDVINQAWTPLYDLTNVFESFLPQLLTYPNPKDPINQLAASLYMYHRDIYNKRVSDYVRQYATKEVLKDFATKKETDAATKSKPEVPTSGDESDSSSSASSMSDCEDEPKTTGKKA